MIIKKIFLGNECEAFVETRISPSFNIIYSLDNNKGKTVVMQSLIYALGGEPLFPNSFPYKNYYYIVVIEVEGKPYTICRKNESFVVKTETGFNLFNSTAEYKYYFNKVIFQLPQIIKNGIKKIVDFSLLCELFYLPQTSRNTSNILNYGYYKKQDFENMLYALMGISSIDSNEDDDTIKERLRALKAEQTDLKKKNKILKSAKRGLNVTSLEVNRVQFEKKLQRINLLKDRISDLINARNRATNKRIKYEMLGKELRSLNIALPQGKLKCLDCGSTNIGYSPAGSDILFDVSDNETRKRILESISSQIDLLSEEIEKATFSIEEYQKELQEELKDDSIDLATVLLIKPETIDSSSADLRLSEISKEIIQLNCLLKTTRTNTAEILQAQTLLKENIIADMRSFYQTVEPNGNSVFDQIYTTSYAPFSGSEETEFYLSRLYSFSKNIHHTFPIIVDGFREGEIDSNGERSIIEKFSQINNQIIFTATLKNEEEHHYDRFSFINGIDYSGFQDSKLLKKDYVPELKEKLRELGISI